MIENKDKQAMLMSRRRLLKVTGLAVGLSALAGLPTRAAPKQVALPVPPLLETRRGQPLYLSMQRTHWAFHEDARVATWGFNGRYLGPTIRVRDGDDVKLVYSNRLNEPVALTVSGLQVAGELMGNAPRIVSPNADWSPIVPVRQSAATCWYHAITPKKMASHVYNGLAGMWIVEDAQSRGLTLPAQYGVNDFPLILQDKHFNSQGQPQYDANQQNGFLGDTLLTNGVTGPNVEVGRGWIRLRLLNASNARRYTLNVSDGRPLYLIANDGGLLPSPVGVSSLHLAPGERRDVLIDMSNGEEAAIIAGANARMMDRIRRLFEPVNALSSTLVLTLKPTGLMSVVTETLPASLNAQHNFDGNVTRTRKIVLGDETPGINGLPGDKQRIDMEALQGSWERWHITSTKPQPFHLQGALFLVDTVNGARPPAQESGWKDTVWVDGEVELLVKFNQASSTHFPFRYYSQNLEMADRGSWGQLLVVAKR